MRSGPSKASEVGACKDLKGEVFPIGSGNKGKDEDMLRTSAEKMALYICTEFGADAAQDGQAVNKPFFKSQPICR